MTDAGRGRGVRFLLILEDMKEKGMWINMIRLKKIVVLVIMVEVKAKASAAAGDPVEMVGPEKQRRLRRAAAAWLAAHPELAGLEVSFEVLAVRPDGVDRVAEAF